MSKQLLFFFRKETHGLGFEVQEGLGANGYAKADGHVRRLQMLTAINLSTAANRQKGTNYFIKGGKSRTPDILFLGKIYHTLFSVDHCVKIHVYLSSSSEEASVPPGCFSTGYPPLRILFPFHKVLLTTGNFSADSQPGRGSLGSLGTAAKAGSSPPPCIVWNVGLSFQIEK